MPSSEPTSLPRAVLFDMDGTLTEPLLDFARIKSDMGIGDRPILEALATLEGSRRREAAAVLLKHEDHAAENSTLNPGCREILNWLNDLQVGCAVVTRNTRRSLEIVMRRHNLAFGVMVTRDDCVHKPSPDPLLLACERLSVAPADAWMVGDGPYDVEAGLAAGMKTIWLSHGKPRSFDAMPWREVRDLLKLHDLLRKCGRPAQSAQPGNVHGV